MFLALSALFDFVFLLLELSVLLLFIVVLFLAFWNRSSFQIRYSWYISALFCSGCVMFLSFFLSFFIVCTHNERNSLDQRIFYAIHWTDLMRGFVCRFICHGIESLFISNIAHSKQRTFDFIRGHAIWYKKLVNRQSQYGSRVFVVPAACYMHIYHIFIFFIHRIVCFDID